MPKLSLEIDLDLYRLLRAAGALTLSLVAVDGADGLVGHVAFSPVTIAGRAGRWYGLGPISVRPSRQRSGIGARLMDEGLARLRYTTSHPRDMDDRLIEAHRGLTEGAKEIIAALKERGGEQPVALAINKIDRVKAEVLLALAEKMNTAFPFAKTFMISAEKGYGVQDLREWLAEQIPAGPWFYPEDQIADLPMRMIAAEITREKLFLRIHDEIPYNATVDMSSTAGITMRQIHLDLPEHGAQAAMDRIVAQFEAAGLDVGEQSQEKNTFVRSAWTPVDGGAKGIAVVDAGGSHVVLMATDYEADHSRRDDGYVAALRIQVNSK